MATFYLLPPRDCLERAVADLFAKLPPQPLKPKRKKKSG